MTSSKFMAVLAMLVILLPVYAMGDNYVPPVPWFYDQICQEVECGKGTCKASPNFPFSFTCECDKGWKRTRLDDEDHLQFLPCVIPNCKILEFRTDITCSISSIAPPLVHAGSLDYSCQPAPPPVPAVEIPYNTSFFDPCYWIYCGEGNCTKTSSYKHTCQCKPGFNNLLNITAYPCYSDCTIGSDCERLGIRVSKSTSTPGGNSGSQVILPGKFNWIAILMMVMAMVLWK